MQAQSSTNVKGIDVSNWQGNVNWQSVKNQGYKFAFTKATEGTGYTDPKFTGNVHGAKAVGMPIGAYHFAHPEANDPIVEAAHYINTIKGMNLDLIPVLDLEEPTDPSKVTESALIDWVNKWINYVEQATGQIVMIYTGNWFINDYHGLNNAFCTRPLWIANYGSSVPDAGGWTNWTVWQYYDKGVVNGVSGNVDMDAGVSLDALIVKPINLTGAITADSGLHVRSLPSTQATPNYTLNKGDVIHVDKSFVAGGIAWYHTTYGALGGWVWQQYVDTTPKPVVPTSPAVTSVAKPATVTGDVVSTIGVKPMLMNTTPATPIAVTPSPTPAPAVTAPTPSTSGDWMVQLGEQALAELVAKGYISSPDAWKDKMHDTAENWLLFHLVAELAERIGK